MEPQREAPCRGHFTQHFLRGLHRAGGVPSAASLRSQQPAMVTIGSVLLHLKIWDPRTTLHF